MKSNHQASTEETKQLTEKRDHSDTPCWESYNLEEWEGRSVLAATTVSTLVKSPKLEKVINKEKR